jgi:hypothetical protein
MHDPLEDVDRDLNEARAKINATRAALKAAPDIEPVRQAVARLNRIAAELERVAGPSGGRRRRKTSSQTGPLRASIASRSGTLAESRSVTSPSRSPVATVAPSGANAMTVTAAAWSRRVIRAVVGKVPEDDRPVVACRGEVPTRGANASAETRAEWPRGVASATRSSVPDAPENPGITDN